MHHTEYKQSEEDHQKTKDEQLETLWRFKDVKTSLIQKDNWKWEDSLVTHCRNHDQSDDKSTAEHEHAKLVSEVLLQAV